MGGWFMGGYGGCLLGGYGPWGVMVVAQQTTGTLLSLSM